MIHELRIYHVMPGRMEDLHNRFANLTLRVWERIGIRTIGFWTVMIGPSSQVLYYLMEWDNLADREAKWATLFSDPEWIRERAKTELNGPLVHHYENYILQPTRYSNLR